MMLFNLRLNHIIQAVLGRLSVERTWKRKQKSDTKINKVTTLHLHNWQICLMRIALNSAWIIYEPTFIRLNVGFISTYFIYISTFPFSFSLSRSLSLPFLPRSNFLEVKATKKSVAVECRFWGVAKNQFHVCFRLFPHSPFFALLLTFTLTTHSLSPSLSLPL